MGLGDHSYTPAKFQQFTKLLFSSSKNDHNCTPQNLLYSIHHWSSGEITAQLPPQKDFDTIVHFRRVRVHDRRHVCVKMPTAAQPFVRSHASICHNVWKCWKRSERSQHLFLHLLLLSKNVEVEKNDTFVRSAFLVNKCLLINRQIQFEISWQEDGGPDFFFFWRNKNLDKYGRKSYMQHFSPVQLVPVILETTMRIQFTPACLM